MSETLQEMGRIERFWVKRPLTGAALTTMVLGLGGLCAELIIFPIFNTRPVNWGLTIGSVIATPLYFVVFYVLFRHLHLSFRGIKTVQNNWDRKIDNLFRAHPFLVFAIFIPVVGFMALSRDLVAMLMTGSSIRWGSAVYVFIVMMISFVVCFTTARVVARVPSDSDSG